MERNEEDSSHYENSDYNFRSHDENTEQQFYRNSNYFYGITEQQELLQDSSSRPILPNEYQYNAGFEQGQNFPFSTIAPYSHQLLSFNFTNYEEKQQTPTASLPLPEYRCHNCHICGTTLINNESTEQIYCSDCYNLYGITGQGKFLHGNSNELLQPSGHQYNAGLEQGQNFPIPLLIPYSNQLSQSNTLNHEKEQTPMVSLPIPNEERKSGRARTDKAYVESLNEIFIELASLIGLPIPANHKFSREYSSRNRNMSKRGILENVKNWIKKSKREKEELKSKSERDKEEFKTQLEERDSLIKELRNSLKNNRKKIQDLKKRILKGISTH